MKRIQIVKVDAVSYTVEKGPIVQHIIPQLRRLMNYRTKLVTDKQVERAIDHIITLRVRQIIFSETRIEPYPSLLADLIVSIQPIAAPELTLVCEEPLDVMPFQDYDDFLFACKNARLAISEDWPPFGMYKSIGLLALEYNTDSKAIMVSPAVNLTDDDVKKKMWINYPFIPLYGKPVYEVLDDNDLRATAEALVYVDKQRRSGGSDLAHN